jgi:hypothetical protein
VKALIRLLSGRSREHTEHGPPSVAGEGEQELDLAAVLGGDRAEARVGDAVVGEGPGIEPLALTLRRSLEFPGRTL